VAGSCKPLVPLACPLTMGRLRYPMAPRDEWSMSFWQRERSTNGFFVPNILQPTMACTSLSNDEHGRRRHTISDCRGVDASLGHRQARVRRIFFVLCWWVALPEAAKPATARHSGGKHARRRVKEMQAGTMRTNGHTTCGHQYSLKTDVA